MPTGPYGFAGYIGDFDPDHPGREVWAIHSQYEKAEYIAEFRDDKGKIIFGDKPVMEKENGRAMAADIDSAVQCLQEFFFVLEPAFLPWLRSSR